MQTFFNQKIDSLDTIRLLSSITANQSVNLNYCLKELHSLGSNKQYSIVGKSPLNRPILIGINLWLDDVTRRNHPPIPQEGGYFLRIHNL